MSIENDYMLKLKSAESPMSKSSPAKEIVSNKDFRFDTFNNNDFGISIFEQDNAALDLGQSSSFNTFSNQNSNRADLNKIENKSH